MTTEIPRCRCGAPRTDAPAPGCRLAHGALVTDSARARARLEVLMRALEDDARPPIAAPPTPQDTPWPSRSARQRSDRS